MKKLFGGGFLFLCCGVFLNPSFLVPTNSSFPQEEHVERVVSIEVPVRVYKRGRFVRDLSIHDFMLLEDGKPQRIDAVYLIKKKTIEREEKHEEAVKTIQPEIESRNFVLVFEIRYYLPKLNEAMDYFFNRVILEGDSLSVFTPVNSYSIKEEAFKVLPKQKIADQLKVKLRKNIVQGASEYRSLYEQIRRIMNRSGL
ncbi:MAG: hypothetical protein J7L72_05005 [Candidatus Aminicenantes bacterium]|nr:hypothetical protein [Candidatus Aminicenantes bacterium]